MRPSALVQEWRALLAMLLIVPIYAGANATAPEAMASMTDKEVREQLHQMLQAQQDQGPTESFSFEAVRGQLQQEMQLLRDSWPQADDRLATLINQIIATSGFESGLMLALYTLFALAAAYLTERLLSTPIQRLVRRARRQQFRNWFETFCANLVGMGISLIRLAIFAIALSLLCLTQDDASAAGLYFGAVLSTALWVRLVVMGSAWVLSPEQDARGTRLIPLSNQQARRLHRYLVIFAALFLLHRALVGLLQGAGFPPELVTVLRVVSGALLTLILIAMVWVQRQALQRLLSQQPPSTSPLAQLVRQSWPWLLSAWLLLLWTLWGFHLLAGNQELAAKVGLSWWMTLLFPLADRLLAKLLLRLTALPWFQSRSFEERGERMRSVLQNGVRVIMVLVALLSLAEAWGLGTFELLRDLGGGRLMSVVVDTLLILLLAYFAWQLICSSIERHLPEPTDSLENSSLGPGEGGATGGTRTETLLPLLRSMLLALLVITTVLSVLSALGVEIGPLIAGAGVVGIAIGFGAQKLVQDVISGVFFLVDDAFRRGEYIDIGELRGSVEKISLRSMQLRHHLGAVQTVPYGSISTIKNLSRDWVTMKLEIRLPYDADIERVRKIVKKVGQDLQADPELGRHLLLPLKSQGVTRVEESALIVRMKFTAKPGEQWVLRREAYSRVRDALQEAGITFAHPEVRVRMPESIGETSVSNATEGAAEAAAGRVLSRSRSKTGGSGSASKD